MRAKGFTVMEWALYGSLMFNQVWRIRLSRLPECLNADKYGDIST